MSLYYHAVCTTNEDNNERGNHLQRDRSKTCPQCKSKYPDGQDGKVAAHVIPISEKQKRILKTDKVVLITTCKSCNSSADKCTKFPKPGANIDEEKAFWSNRRITSLSREVGSYHQKG